jgi:nucleoside-diphosphate-sugar epimerase
MKDKKVLIIGGSGFLGQEIMKPLLKEEISFFYADLKPIKGMEENFIHLNVLEVNNFKNLDKDFTAVINLTGQVSNPSNLCFELNTKGIHNIISYVKEHNINLIQVSTLSVYGSSKENETNEESKLNPETTYGSCKAFAEYLIQSELLKEQYTIIRLSNLYGDNQPKGILAYLLRSIKQKDDVFFNNDGTLKRYYLNVEDAANMIAQMSLQHMAGIYNYLGKDKYSVKELISLFEEVSNQSLNVSYESNSSWENLQNVTSSKIDLAFDYVAKHSLKDWLIKKIK